MLVTALCYGINFLCLFLCAAMDRDIQTLVTPENQTNQSVNSAGSEASDTSKYN